jgi:hypothetical protein
MTEALRWLGQGITYLAIGVIIGVLADTPSYTAFPPDQALIRLSFSHGGQRPDCRPRTPEELAELPAMMRAPMDCPRVRLSVAVKPEPDGERLYRAVLPPTGIAGDQPSRVYEGFPVAPGTYTVAARLRDSDREEGFDHEREAQVTLEPRQNLVIEFRSDTRGFDFR